MEKRHFESEKVFVQASLVDEICVVNFNMNKDASKVKKACVTASLFVDEVMCTVFSEGGEECLDENVSAAPLPLSLLLEPAAAHCTRSIIYFARAKKRNCFEQSTHVKGETHVNNKKEYTLNKII